jgi:hypothetical protein
MGGNSGEIRCQTLIAKIAKIAKIATIQNAVALIATTREPPGRGFVVLAILAILAIELSAYFSR